MVLEQNSNIGTEVYVPWFEALCVGVGLRAVKSLALIVTLSIVASSHSALLVPT